MQTKDFRSFLNQVQSSQPEGLFRISSTEVQLEYELPSIIRQLQEQDRFPLVLCENVAGHPDFSLASNVCASRDRIALALDTEMDNYLNQYSKRLENPLEPVIVDDGPVRDVIATGDDASLDDLPIVTHAEKEPGPYIDSGVVIVRDDELDRYNTGIFRIMKKGPREATMNIGEGQHTYSIFSRAEKREEPLEFAMYIGHHPAAIFGSQMRTNEDELAAIGGLLGEPLEMVECETVDLVVPAHAEIAIEGELLPGVRKNEGPFGEFHFLYGEGREAPVFKVTAVSRRAQPIYYDIHNLYVDHINHAVVPLEADIYQKCKEAVPETLDVHSPATSSILTTIVQVEKTRPGIAKQAALAALSSNYYVRQVIVVDQEQDPHSLDEVLWAITMKTRPRRDIDFIEDAYIVKSDPMGVSERGWPEKGPLNTKVIIDATKPVDRDYAEPCEPPAEMWETLDLDDYE